MTQKQSRGTAVVTGASSGIGAVYADRLARRGYDMVLVARNEHRLNALADRLRSATGRAVQVVKADLTDKTDLARVEALLKRDASIALLVNNAGFGSVAPLLASDAGTMESMIALNVTALMRLTYAAVPAMVGRGSGAVINIASVVAIGPEILNGVYGASKAFVLAFSQSMQHELADKGIRVQAVLPGATDTEGWDVAGMPRGQLPPSRFMPAEDMVDAALAGFDSGEVVTIPPLQDGDDWIRHEASRNELRQRFAHARPGARYLT